MPKKKKLPPNVVKALARVDQWFSSADAGHIWLRQHALAKGFAFVKSKSRRIKSDRPKGVGDRPDQIEYRCEKGGKPYKGAPGRQRAYTLTKHNGEPCLWSAKLACYYNVEDSHK